MNPFHFVKAFLVSIPTAWRARRYKEVQVQNSNNPPPKKSKFQWQGLKNILLVAIIVGGIGFGSFHIYEIFKPETVPGLILYKRSSLPLSKDQNVIFTQFRDLVEKSEEESRKENTSFGIVRLVEIQPNLQSANIWITDKLTNPGYAPLSMIERPVRNANTDSIQYYNRDGDPYDLVIKTWENSRRRSFLLELGKNVIPACSNIVAFRYDTQKYIVKADKIGRYLVDLGRLPSAKSGIFSVGVKLPEGAKIISFDPKDGLLTPSENTTMIAWLNSRIEKAGTQLSVSFMMSK
jgi:hypothetical protein